MKKLTFIACLALMCFSIQSFAQTNPKESLVPDTNIPKTIMKEKKPSPYPNSREADIVWSMKIWRIIDLREKINYPLYFPTVEMQGRQSLVQALANAAFEGKITAYDTDSDEFTTALTPEELQAKFEVAARTETREKLDGSGDTTIVIRDEFNWGEVQELYVKEEWYFDKHYSKMYARVIGICPIRVYNRQINSNDDEEEILGDKVKTQLFWVYYPEARETLTNTACYVSENEVSQLSFDDLFTLRRFSSYIVATTNTMNNRRIDAYTRNGLEAMLESQRIESSLLNFEHDLWEF